MAELMETHWAVYGRMILAVEGEERSGPLVGLVNDPEVSAHIVDMHNAQLDAAEIVGGLTQVETKTRTLPKSKRTPRKPG